MLETLRSPGIRLMSMFRWVAIVFLFVSGVQASWDCQDYPKNSSNHKNFVLLVSDIDDTIKISNVGQLSQLILNHLRGPKSFHYLIEIYKSLRASYLKKNIPVHFAYVTSTPDVMDIRKWLVKMGAPCGAIFQKNLFDFFLGTFHFKYHSIQKHLERLKSKYPLGKLELFLFGDSGELDPLVYQKVLDVYGPQARKAASYIRMVSAQSKDFAGQYYYISELELSYEKNLLPHVDQSLREKIYQAAIARKLIPKYIVNEFEIDNY